MGGDCLNSGCIPSKALIHLANEYHTLHQYIASEQLPPVDFKAAMSQVQNVIHQIEPHDSIERYRKLGVDCIQGEAYIESPWHVRVNNQLLSTKNIIVATGASPFVPPIKGLNKISYLTSDNLWQIKTLPQELLILGGGPIGCELAQAFSRLGSQVTLVEMAPRLMIREDPEVSALIEKTFRQEGIKLLCYHKAMAFEQNRLHCEYQGKNVNIDFDQVLVAVGRRANTSGFGLEKLAIKLNPDKTIKVNEKMQSSIASIYACGDVAGPYQFTHSASHQAWYATVNSLFRPFISFKVDYRIIPWATFTSPEVARVGLNETEAKQQNIPYELTEYDLGDLDRAIADQQASGFIRVLTPPGKDKILGVTIVGQHASELIAEWILAIKHNLGLKKIMSTIHIYPTHSEANKYLAGIWMKNHKPEKLLGWLKRFHQWRIR